MKSYLEEVKEYFKTKAKNYDLVEKQLYWCLSDNLLWYALKQLVLDKVKNKEIKILDAGGGTCRWLIKIIEYLRNSKGTIYDISEDMLAVAKEKIIKKRLQKRITVINGNIENMKDEIDSQYDIVICFHNALGFVTYPTKAFSEMSRVLKKGGYLVLVIPNKCHGLFFNIFTKRFHILDSIMGKNMGNFVDDMPHIHFFTLNYVRDMYQNLNFKEVKIFGFPVTIYPEIQETKISGNTRNIEEILSDKKIFEKIEKIEKNLILNEDIAARGNNLLAIGQK